MPVSSEATAPPLPDLGDAVFDHGGVTEPVINNIFAQGEVDDEYSPPRGSRQFNRAGFKYARKFYGC